MQPHSKASHALILPLSSLSHPHQSPPRKNTSILGREIDLGSGVSSRSQRTRSSRHEKVSPRSEAVDLVLAGYIIQQPMMAMKGYFRAPRLHGRKHKQQQQAAEAAAAQRGEHYGGESLSAALLDADAGAGVELAAAVAVPKGYFAVYVGAEARRFVVPTSYLRQPAFRDLMERAAEEFGFARAGAIRIPCREEDFQATVAALDEAAVAARRRRRPAEPARLRRPSCPRPGRCSSKAS